VSKPRAPADQFAEFFQWHAILPTPLHEALQEAARQEGWTAPWDREDQEVQKKAAGKKSGAIRGGLAGLRRSLVEDARARLKPAYRAHPYSTQSIDDLHREYRYLLTEGSYDVGSLGSLKLLALSEADRQTLIKVKRETLIKDLKVLGIHSKRQKPRSG
jgi:hypothetical protein